MFVLNVSCSLYCFTSIFHGVKNYFSWLWVESKFCQVFTNLDQNGIINIPNFKIILDLCLDVKLSAVICYLGWMIFFKISHYCMEYFVSLMLNCDTILKQHFLSKKELFHHFLPKQMIQQKTKYTLCKNCFGIRLFLT